MSTAGATPKLTKSASESSSAPKREVPLRRRASLPSTASSMIATMTAPTAKSYRASTPSLIAVTPLQSASSVMRLGSRNRSGICLNRLRRCSRVRALMSSVKSGTSAIASAPAAQPLGLARGEIGDDRLAGDGALSDHHERVDARRKINIDAAPEADEPDPPAGKKPLALRHEADDAPRDQARNLHDAELAAVIEDEGERLALVVLARFVEIGVEELARDIGDAGDRAVGGRAVHVH